jgi:anti-anti-sigma factor
LAASIQLQPGDAGDSYSVIAVAGELDLSAASVFADALRRASEQHPGGALIDLTNCGFIDSTGISLLLNASRRQTRAREGMAVLCPNPTPRRVFEITGTVSTLNVVTHQAAAEAAIESTRLALAQAPEPQAGN